MKIKIIVEVEVERTQGKFESKDSLAESVQELIQEIDGSDIEGVHNGGEYTVTVSSMEVV